MKIDKIRISGYRCFGEPPVTVNFASEITALIGANGSGKTALLSALLRMFGVSRSQRGIIASDFHLPPGTVLEDAEERSLWIEVYLSFPELEEQEDSPSVPPFFRNMVVTEEGASPFVRARLDAVWKPGPVMGGSIEELASWVLSGDDDPGEDKIQRMSSHERGLIQVNYIPASRDVSETLSRSTDAMMGRLLRAVRWSDVTRDTIEDSITAIRDAFVSENAIQQVNRFLLSRWQELHRDPVYARPELHTLGSRFDDVIRRLAIAFHPDEQGNDRPISELSDGQKSLFYFALVASVFDLEDSIRNSVQGTRGPQEAEVVGDAEVAQETVAERGEREEEGQPYLGFDPALVHTPALTIFAFEEPENHLSPYYLARIIDQIRSFSGTHAAQAILTSHSSGVPHRVSPTELRYFRLDQDTRTVSPKSILIPSAPEEEAKYVQEAVHAYPELYFGKYVILGEGDSEKIVLPHLARAIGSDLDSSFVAMVPLGGRHVNHFWRLLSDLSIPHCTLLDLDLGRGGGGWGRIKYVLEQLLAVGVEEKDLLTFESSGGDQIALAREDLKHLDDRPLNDPELEAWIRHLEEYDVFFSAPLDLDLLMLSTFPAAYQSSAPGTPRLNPEQAADVVLGVEGAFEEYRDEFEDILPWYRYLFLSRSKPVTHLEAISSILRAGDANEALQRDMPPVLRRALELAAEAISLNPDV